MLWALALSCGSLIEFKTLGQIALQKCGFVFFGVSGTKIRCKHAILYRAKARIAGPIRLRIYLIWENVVARPALCFPRA